MRRIVEQWRSIRIGYLGRIGSVGSRRLSCRWRIGEGRLGRGLDGRHARRGHADQLLDVG